MTHHDDDDPRTARKRSIGAFLRSNAEAAGRLVSASLPTMAPGVYRKFVTDLLGPEAAELPPDVLLLLAMQSKDPFVAGIAQGFHQRRMFDMMTELGRKAAAEKKAADAEPGIILEPCQRDGGPGDWWRERHKMCTGYQHTPLGNVHCGCSCHVYPVAGSRP